MFGAEGEPPAIKIHRSYLRQHEPTKRGLASLPDNSARVVREKDPCSGNVRTFGENVYGLSRQNNHHTARTRRDAFCVGHDISLRSKSEDTLRPFVSVRITV